MRKYQEEQIIHDKAILKRLGKKVARDFQQGRLNSAAFNLKLAFQRKEILLMDYHIMRHYIYKK